MCPRLSGLCSSSDLVGNEMISTLSAAESIPVPDAVSLTSIDGSSFPGADGGGSAQKS